MAIDTAVDKTTKIKHPPVVCYWIGISLVVYLIASLFLIVSIHINLLVQLTNFQLLRAHLMCGSFGMLGAAMAATRKFYHFLITESVNKTNETYVPKIIWDFGWTFYYVTRPILGGILGSLSYTLSFVGVNILTSSGDGLISKQGHYLLYGLAFISGFSVSQVLDRLNAVAKQVFKSRPESGGE
jgi:hypothetical protein